MKPNKIVNNALNSNGNVPKPIRRGSLRSREILLLNENVNLHQERVESAAKRKGVENDAGAKRQRTVKAEALKTFDALDKEEAYSARARELSRQIFSMAPESQKVILKMKAPSNPYAGYLLADLLLRGEPSFEDKQNAIGLIKTYLKELKDEFGDIQPESELFDDYAYAHYLLGMHLDKNLNSDEIKYHLTEAAKHDDYNHDAGFLYGNQLEHEENYERSIAHWQDMIRTSKQKKHNDAAIGIIYNRLGCAFVASGGDHPTLAQWEEAVNAFEMGMVCGDEVARENWDKFKSKVPEDMEKFLEEQEESVSYSPEIVIAQQSSEERSAVVPNLVQLSDAAADLPRIAEPAKEVLDDTQESPPPEKEVVSTHADEILADLKEAASYGNLDAIYQLANILTDGKGPIQSNPVEALPYWEELGKRGDVRANLKQIDILIKTQPDSIEHFDKIIALARSIKAAKEDFVAMANSMLGLFLFQKAQMLLNAAEVVPPHNETILACLKEAASYDNLDAINLLATILTDGKGAIQPNLEQALPYWEKLAEKGQTIAYAKQIDILVKTQQESLELFLKVIGLARVVKETPEYADWAKHTLSVYLFKKAQIFLNM